MRNKGLDLLKLICIIFVIVTHYDNIVRDGLFFPFVIDMAVPVFMIISGYVNSLSVRKKGLSGYYKIGSIVPKLSRFVLPFLVVVLLETVYLVASGTTIYEILKKCVFGLWGDGSYYPYLLVQFVIVFPLIYKCSKSKKGILVVIIINILFEMAATMGFINLGIYRISLLRHLGFIMAGILIEKHEEKISGGNITSLLLGGLVVAFLNAYIPQNYIFGVYTYTSLPVVLWASGIMLIFLRIPEKSGEIGVIRFLAFLGNATYHILLTQMLIYYFLNSYITGILVVALVVVSIAIGTLWHMVDLKIQTKVKTLCKG